MDSLEFDLNLPTEEVLAVYRGEARTVVATLDDGRTIRFPSDALRLVVNENGVSGRFRLTFDENKKMQGLERVT